MLRISEKLVSRFVAHIANVDSHTSTHMAQRIFDAPPEVRENPPVTQANTTSVTMVNPICLAYGAKAELAIAPATATVMDVSASCPILRLVNSLAVNELVAT